MVPVLEKIFISTAPIPIAIIILHHIMLEITTIVSLLIKVTALWTIGFFLTIHSGQQCDNEGTCCTGANTPPWFSVELHNSTSDDIEVRICHDQDTIDEDTPIQLLEIYVQ